MSAGDVSRGKRDLGIGGLVRDARRRAGISQSELARRLKVPRSAVCRLENRAANVGVSTLARIAEALGFRLVIRIE
jgi:HTH-type transcriptional regulator/antitoxin HipB